MKKIVCLSALAAGLAAAGAIEIRSDYPGGNIKVEKIDEAAGVVKVAPDLRDTKHKWFHFDFTLTGAAGRTLHFQYPSNSFNYLATLGPAISRDGGATFEELPDGLYYPTGVRRCLVVDRERLFGLTRGSGVWMRNIGGLGQ